MLGVWSWLFKQKTYGYLLSGIITLGSGHFALAQSPNSGRTTFEDKFIESNIAISEWFDSAADGIDLFLVGSRRVTTKRNETAFRVENTTISTEGQSLNNVTNFNIRLKLPNVERYWALKFTSYDEQREERGVRRSYLRQTPREKNYGATVGFFRKLGNIRTSFEPRIELEDPLKVSHSLEFESVVEYRSYRLNPKLEFFASPTRGVGTFQAININLFLTKIYTLTLINQGEYQERIRTFSGTHGFSIGQEISKRKRLSYTALIFANNRPAYETNAYNISVAWDEVIYKRILDYQIIPNIEFNKTRNYKGLLSLTFNINLQF